MGNTGYGVYAQQKESKGSLEQGFFVPTSGCFVTSKVVDPSHFNADPDPSFPFIVDLYLTFHFNLGPDPGPALHQSDRNLQPLVCIFSLHASSVSVHGSSWLHFEPLLLVFK